MMKTIIWVTILCGIALAAPQVRKKRSEEKAEDKPLEKPGPSPLDKLKCHHRPLSVVIFKRTLLHLLKRVDYGVETSLTRVQAFNQEAATDITSGNNDKLTALAEKWESLAVSTAKKVDHVAGDLAIMALAISEGYTADFDDYNRCGNFTTGLSNLGELVNKPKELLERVVRVVVMDSVCFNVTLSQILGHEDLKMYDETKPVGEKKAMEMTFALLQELHRLKLNGKRLLHALGRVGRLLAGEDNRGGKSEDTDEGSQEDQGQGSEGQGGKGQGGKGHGGPGGPGGRGPRGEGQGGPGGQGEGGPKGDRGEGQGGPGGEGQGGPGGEGQGGPGGQGQGGPGGQGQGGPGGQGGQGQTTTDKRILNLLRRYLEMKRGQSGGCSHEESYEEEDEENRVVVAPYTRKEFFGTVRYVIGKVMQIHNRLKNGLQEMKKQEMSPEEAGEVLKQFYGQMMESGRDIDESLGILIHVVVRLYINSNSTEFVPMDECGALSQMADLKDGATAADVIKKLQEVTKDNAQCFRLLINVEHQLENELNKYCNGMTEEAANRLMEYFFMNLHLLRQTGTRFFITVGQALKTLATPPVQQTQGRELQLMETELRGLLEKRLAHS